jgi:hypothetical protein
VTPIAAAFERCFARVVFPADASRAELRALCRAMFDAGRRSVQRAARQPDPATQRKAAKARQP